VSKPKPKIVKDAVPMPKQAPKERSRNFNEVAKGYEKEQAIREAERCLQCALVSHFAVQEGVSTQLS